MWEAELAKKKKMFLVLTETWGTEVKEEFHSPVQREFFHTHLYIPQAPHGLGTGEK